VHSGFCFCIENSNYRYNSVVHTDRSSGPFHARTVLDRDSISSADRGDQVSTSGASALGHSPSTSSNIASGSGYRKISVATNNYSP
jgi:hypothetical protein